jgi:hypothetical protein
MNDTLLQAVGKYLQVRLKERRFCPVCMGTLPANHDPECHLSALAEAYETAAKTPLTLPTPQVAVTQPTKKSKKKVVATQTGMFI